MFNIENGMYEASHVLRLKEKRDCKADVTTTCGEMERSINEGILKTY